MCKRIKGVAGDMVYFKHKNRDPMLLQVPEGHVWLLGDNTANSNDSRYYGPVPLGMLEGRIFFKIGLNPLRAGSLDAAATKVENGPSTKLKETSEVNETQETKETKENADLIERRNVGNNS